jgi:hypothetical protein
LTHAVSSVECTPLQQPTTSSLNCDSRRPPLRRNHWGTLVPHRGEGRLARSVASLHRSDSGRSDGVDAILRPDARRSGASAE